MATISDDYSTNLVSHWILHEESGTRYDSHGSNDLTDNNTVTSTTDGDRTVAVFNKANDEYLSITDTNQTGLDISGDLTVNAWVKFDNTDDATQTIVSKWAHASENQYRCVANPHGTNGLIQLLTDNACTNYSYQHYTPSYTSFDSTNWFMLTWVRTGTTAYIYINGSLLGSGTVETSANCDAVFALGIEAGRNVAPFGGRMHDVSVWSDDLSSTDISNIYNSGDGILYEALPEVAGDIDVLVVGGGGGGAGGGSNVGNGGGGGGGYLYITDQEVNVGDYTVTVGAGGAAGSSQGNGSNGGDSSLGSLVVADGGGGGGKWATNGLDGGSGGGSGGNATGGSATTGQGYDGGSASSNQWRGTGGGGASQAGETISGGTSSSPGGYGGDGASCSISGSAVTYAGGGGGGTYSGAGGAGGDGGGGDGGGSGGNSTAGTANTGGGGGGSKTNVTTGSPGGSGIVIVRYKTSDFGTCTGGTITTDGAYTVHTFTSDGTMTFVAGNAFIPKVIFF